MKGPMPKYARGPLAALSLCTAALFSGCGASSTPGSQAAQSALPALAGAVHGGQQPIAGASIYLYAAGATGPGKGASNLLTTPAVTGADGSFSITGTFTCPTSTTQVYLLAQGGNPGLVAGTNNTAILEMAADRTPISRSMS